jgi:hypothetical protein
MKLKDIFNWIKKITKPEKGVAPVIADDPYAMIKHKTQERYIGRRKMEKHNNRKMTRGRRVQYVQVGKVSKPIYHSAK